MKFRIYRDGDEEDIVNLLKICFGTFNSWNISVMDWLNYEKDDCGFKRYNALVAEDNGKIIGHLHLIHRRIKIGNCTLDCGGIANVATHPDYRERGVATKLMQMALEICKRNNWHISSLFTGYGSRGYRIYRSMGYANTTFINEYIGVRECVERVLMKLLNLKFELSDMDSSDLDDVMKVYEEYSFNVSGCCERNIDYWKNKILNKTYYQSFFYEDKGAGIKLIARNGDIPKAYSLSLNTLKSSRSKWQDKIAFVMEVAAEKENEIKIMIKETLNQLLKEDFKIFRMRLPVSDEMNEVMKYFELMKGAIYMDYILNQTKLFNVMKIEFERRIKEYPELNSIFSIESPYGSTKIELSKECINIEDGSLSNKVKLTREGITKLIYGIKSFDEIVNDDRYIVEMNIDNKSLKAMKILFQKRMFQVSPIDEW